MSSSNQQFSPIIKVDPSTLPVAVFETGFLKPGLPIYQCPSCSLMFNRPATAAQENIICAHCGLRPRLWTELTEEEKIRAQNFFTSPTMPQP